MMTTDWPERKLQMMTHREGQTHRRMVWKPDSYQTLLKAIEKSKAISKIYRGITKETVCGMEADITNSFLNLKIRKS